MRSLSSVPTDSRPHVLGDVLYLSVLGKSIVILNSEEAAVELLDKRSSLYSDRPRFPMQDLFVFPDLVWVVFLLIARLPFRIGWTDVLVFLPYGEQFQKQRKLLQQPLGRQAVSKFQHIQVAQAHTLLHNLLEDPNEVEHHTKRYISSGTIIVDMYLMS